MLINPVKSCWKHIRHLDAILPLTSGVGVEAGVGVRVKLLLVSDPTKDVNSAVDGFITRLDDAGEFTTISGHVDMATSATGTADKVAQTLGPCTAPLAQALQSLDHIVTIVDGIVDVCSLRSSVVFPFFKFVTQVHPICKIAWTLLSSVYKVSAPAQNIFIGGLGGVALFRCYEHRCFKTTPFEIWQRVFATW